MSMQISQLSRLRMARRQTGNSAWSDWRALVRLWVGRWLARAARADGLSLTTEDRSKIDDVWLDTAPASRVAHALGVDGAPAMVFTDSMPRYSACLDRPRSTIIGSPAGEPTRRARGATGW
jgi:hypothetical protein